MTDGLGFANDLDALNKFVVVEQELLWHELDDTVQRYSMSSAISQSLLCRLAWTLLLVPPTPYSKVQWRLLASGVYETVLQCLEIAVPVISDEEWEDLDRMMARYGGTRAVLMRNHEIVRTEIREILAKTQEKGFCYGND